MQWLRLYVWTTETDTKLSAAAADRHLRDSRLLDES